MCHVTTHSAVAACLYQQRWVGTTWSQRQCLIMITLPGHARRACSCSSSISTANLCHRSRPACRQYVAVETVFRLHQFVYVSDLIAKQLQACSSFDVSLLVMHILRKDLTALAEARIALLQSMPMTSSISRFTLSGSAPVCDSSAVSNWCFPALQAFATSSCFFTA